MRTIEKVIVKKTLKCGSKIYGVGEYKHPIPEDLIIEARVGSRVVEVVFAAPEPAPVVKITRKEEVTSTSEVGTSAFDDIIDPKKVKTTTTPPPKPSKKKRPKPKAKPKAPVRRARRIVKK